MLCSALCGLAAYGLHSQVQKWFSCGTGGLTGFNVAKDLLKLDFSNPEEAPEEFRAVVFNAPPAKKGMRMPSLTALEIQTQGNNMSPEESDHESVIAAASAQCLRIHRHTGMQHP